jgi:hypothetical protein
MHHELAYCWFTGGHGPFHLEVLIFGHSSCDLVNLSLYYLRGLPNESIYIWMPFEGRHNTKQIGLENLIKVWVVDTWGRNDKVLGMWTCWLMSAGTGLLSILWQVTGDGIPARCCGSSSGQVWYWLWTITSSSCELVGYILITTRVVEWNCVASHFTFVVLQSCCKSDLSSVHSCVIDLQLSLIVVHSIAVLNVWKETFTSSVWTFLGTHNKEFYQPTRRFNKTIVHYCVIFLSRVFHHDTNIQGHFKCHIHLYFFRLHNYKFLEAVGPRAGGMVTSSIGQECCCCGVARDSAKEFQTDGTK